MEKVSLSKVCRLSSEVILDQVEIEEMIIFGQELGNSNNRSSTQKELAKEGFHSFIQGLSPTSILAFTDGSVAGEECFGHGGCGVVLFKNEVNPELSVKERKVGKLVENVKCEVEGIILAFRNVSGEMY